MELEGKLIRSGFFSLGCFCIFGFLIFLGEFLDPSGSVHKFLLARVKRMAGGTNFNMDVLHRGTDINLIATGAHKGGFMIFRMNLSFHNNLNLS